MSQGQEELHQVQAGTEQNGELSVETPTNDHPSPRTSGNDHLRMWDMSAFPENQVEEYLTNTFLIVFYFNVELFYI